MFCGECGTKNKKGSLFCENCGSKLVKNDEVVENKKEDTQNEVVKEEKVPKKEKNNKKVAKEEIKEESVQVEQPKEEIVEEKIEEKKNTSTNAKKSKKKPVLLVIALLIIGACVGGYFYLSNLYSPENVAKDYIKALASNDVDKIYKYYNIESSEFVSKEKFKEYVISGDSDVTLKKLTVESVEKYYDSTAKVKLKYVIADDDDKFSTKEDSIEVKLEKTKDNNLFIFDNWKVVVEDKIIVEDYKITLPKGSKLTIDDVKVSEKYLDKSEKSVDLYVIPQMLTTKYKIGVELPMGIDITDEVFVYSSSSYTPRIDVDSLSSKQVKEIKEEITSSLQLLYNDAIKKLGWTEAKEDFEFDDCDLSSLQKTYENLLKSLDSASSQLYEINFTNIDIDSISLDKNGLINVNIDTKYNYSLEYVVGEELKTHSSSTSDSINITFSYVDDEFKITNVTSLPTYFSRYY